MPNDDGPKPPKLFVPPTPEQRESAARHVADELDKLAVTVGRVTATLGDLSPYAVTVGDHVGTEMWRLHADALNLQARLFTLLHVAFSAVESLSLERIVADDSRPPRKPRKPR